LLHQLVTRYKARLLDFDKDIVCQVSSISALAFAKELCYSLQPWCGGVSHPDFNKCFARLRLPWPNEAHGGGHQFLPEATYRSAAFPKHLLCELVPHVALTAARGHTRAHEKVIAPVSVFADGTALLDSRRRPGGSGAAPGSTSSSSNANTTSSPAVGAALPTGTTGRVVVPSAVQLQRSWCYCGSANLSASAWGQRVGDRVEYRNEELGALFSPELWVTVRVPSALAARVAAAARGAGLVIGSAESPVGDRSGATADVVIDLTDDESPPAEGAASASLLTSPGIGVLATGDTLTELQAHFPSLAAFRRVVVDPSSIDAGVFGTVIPTYRGDVSDSGSMGRHLGATVVAPLCASPFCSPYAMPPPQFGRGDSKHTRPFLNPLAKDRGARW